MPLVSVMSDPSSVENNAILRELYQRSGAEDVDAFVVILGFGFLLVLFTSLGFKAVSQWAQIRFTKMRVYAVGYRLTERYLAQPYSWFWFVILLA